MTLHLLVMVLLHPGVLLALPDGACCWCTLSSLPAKCPHPFPAVCFPLHCVTTGILSSQLEGSLALKHISQLSSPLPSVLCRLLQAGDKGVGHDWCWRRPDLMLASKVVYDLLTTTSGLDQLVHGFPKSQDKSDEPVVQGIMLLGVFGRRVTCLLPFSRRRAPLISLVFRM